MYSLSARRAPAVTRVTGTGCSRRAGDRLTSNILLRHYSVRPTAIYLSDAALSASDGKGLAWDRILSAS